MNTSLVLRSAIVMFVSVLAAACGDSTTINKSGNTGGSPPGTGGATGGTVPVGGNATGGVATGGAATGGAATGGAATG